MSPSLSNPACCLLEMARLCADIGMSNAYNLDGGFTAAIFLNSN